MFMVKKVLNFIEEKKMLQRGDSVILGVSGGADSLCLLIILNEISKLWTEAYGGSRKSSCQGKRGR